MKANIRNIITFLLILGVVIVGSSFLMEKTDNAEKFTYSKLVELFEKDLVKDFIIDENDTITLHAYQLDSNGYIILDSQGAPVLVEYSYRFSYLLQVDQILYIIEENIHYSKIKQSCDGKIHITRKTRI